MSKERLLSLDVFRGITIAAMILVNDPGDWGNVYAPLLHAKWHGLTPTDLVFPFFVFIMGVAIALGRPKEGSDRKIVMRKASVRAVKLFTLGLFLNGFPYFEIAALRIPGVLQRLALVFIALVFMHQYFRVKTQYYISAVLLIGYWVIMSWVPVPGIGEANLEPGSNFAAWIDSILLTGHMWSQTGTWDPEGVLSTFPAVVSGLMGLWTGNYLLHHDRKNHALIKVFVFGNLAILLALAWDMHFPINKSLWTSSFVLVTGGLGMLGFAMLFWLLDVEKKQGFWTFPFKVFGMNAIAAYVFAGVLATLMGVIEVGDASLHGHFYSAITYMLGDGKFASLVHAILFVSISYLFIWVLYKKQIFLKV